MLLFAGLVGMMAVGSLAFLGMSDEDEDDVAGDATQDVDGAPQDGAEAAQDGPGILDFANAADDAGARAGAQVAPEAAGETRVDPADATEDEPRETDGSDGRNVQAGDDRLDGSGDDDVLLGGAGDDSLTGGDGDDTLNGEEDDDEIDGGPGADQLFGGVGDDLIAGGPGDDSMNGGAGDDTLAGGAGDDAVHGGLDDDVLTGGAGQDTLFGGWGDDTLSGVEDDPETAEWDDLDGLDYLNGGGGDDAILAGADDIVTTGDGADTVTLGEWLDAEHQAHILDFSTAEDNLIVIFDDLADPDPDVTIEPDEEDRDIRHLVLNGARIAAVHGAPGLSLTHVTLMGQSVYAPPDATAVGSTAAA